MEKGLGQVAYWAFIGALAVAITYYSGPRQDIQILTYAVIALAAIMLQWFMKVHKEQREREEKDRENLDFTLSMMWSIMRRSLVSDHDKYVYQYGAVNDTQRTVFESDYEAYEALCEKLGKTNGVMDNYFAEVMNLPNVKGGPQKKGAAE